ncbi:MAG: membrane protein insertion efficiency factor YidD [Spirochaetota bacterium]
MVQTRGAVFLLAGALLAAWCVFPVSAEPHTGSPAGKSPEDLSGRKPPDGGFGEGGSQNAYQVLIGPQGDGEGLPPLDEGFLYSAVRFYRKHISVLDGPRCMFYPTCSQFCIKAWENYGFFWGTVMTIDRLFYREQKSSMKFYPYAEQKGRYLDPVYRNYIFLPGDYWK